MEIKKSYYAVIPANVRYDKNLCANAKLLYGEITALCNDKGFCWASNQYFVDLYEVDKRSIARWINALVDNGYIIKNIQYADDGKTILQRCLSLPNNVSNVTRYGQNCHEGTDKIVTTPSDKNVTHNNTLLNNTLNTSNTPLPPQGDSTLIDILDRSNLEKDVKCQLQKWLMYKKFKYTVLGLQSLVTVTSKKIKEFRASAVIDLIEESMASSYKGIIWDKLKNVKPSQQKAVTEFNSNDRQYTKEDLSSFFEDLSEIDKIGV